MNSTSQLINEFGLTERICLMNFKLSFLKERFDNLLQSKLVSEEGSSDGFFSI